MANNIPCVQTILDAAEKVGIEISDRKATKILTELTNYATAKAPQFGGDAVRALEVIATDHLLSAKLKTIAHQRGKVLEVLRKKEMIAQAERFMQKGHLAGEGVSAVLEGSAKDVFGGNHSVATLAQDYNHSWSGELGSKVEAIVPWHEIRTGAHDLAIAQETGIISSGEGLAGSSGDPLAAKVAAIVQESWKKRTKLLNDAGAFRRPTKNFFGVQSPQDPDAKAFAEPSV